MNDVSKNKSLDNQSLQKINPPKKHMIWWGLGLHLILVIGLFGCGGQGAARDELSQTRGLLDHVRKIGCAHPSISLAEQAYAKSQKLFDEKKYDESRTQAAVARQLADEAQKEIKAKPCDVEAPPPVKEIPTVVNSEIDQADDAQVTPFDSEPTTELKTIYFEFDSIAFSAEAVQVLETNLEWLRAHPHQKIVLSGHCDERGTTEYNLALSDKRARKVAQYLQQANIDINRLEIVSFGSEQPASFRRDEEGYRLNRRVEFSFRKDRDPSGE